MTTLTTEQRAALVLAARDQQAVDEFRYFAFYAWNVVNPGRRLVWNWHLSLVCSEVQDFTRPLWDPSAPDSEEREMVVCVPPRSLKSYTLEICLQAWLWLRAPHLQFQAISNDEGLATGFALKTLELIRSSWYMRVLKHAQVAQGLDVSKGPAWHINKGAEADHKNSMGGQRRALGIRSTVTGKGADLQVIGDPYDAKQATRGGPEAVTRRMVEVVDDYDNVLKSRLNDPNRSLRLLIMQRLDVRDLAGELLQRRKAGRRIRAVVLPMEYDPDFPEELGGVHPRDPRTEPGQLLMPGRWSEGWWDDARSTPGAQRHIEAQYNQRPSSKEGALFKRPWFDRSFPGAPHLLRCDEVAIFVDCTFKDTQDGSFVVFQVWGRVGKASFYMLDQVRDHMGFTATVRALVSLRSRWPTCRRVVIEDKANGSAVLDLLKKEVPGLIAWNPGTKSKYERAEVGSAPALQAGQVYYPLPEYAPWLEGYVNRHVAFDGANGTPDDEIDVTSMALLYWTGGAEDPLERLKRQIGGLVR